METPMQTLCPYWIILYFEMVFAVFRSMDWEKHSEHNDSPEYFLEYALWFSHKSHLRMVLFSSKFII